MIVSFLLFVLLVVVSYLLYLSLKRERQILMTYEDDMEIRDSFIDEILEEMNRTYTHVKNIDVRGMFEGDDEVGWIWKDMYNSLDKLNTKYNYNIESKWEEDDKETTSQE